MSKSAILLVAAVLYAGRAVAQHHDHGSPEDAAMEGVMFEVAGWSAMAHGVANTIYDRQGGPRGDTKAFTTSMFMLMGERPFAGGTLGVRTMLSLDPTIGRGGYPLLLQTGETADGHEHLVDRQHPHDAFMELSTTYSRRVGEHGAISLYAGLPGEPALGPPTFMHRRSGERNPEAPITHHWLDSTHITMGVVTAGAGVGPWKLEASRFNGREPDQNRWNIERRKLDSSSVRVRFAPSAAWSFQVSRGWLKSPEQLDPETDVDRTTASAMHERSIHGARWATALAWGRNVKSGPQGRERGDGWLLESSLEFARVHTVFARVETVQNDELLGHHDARAGQSFDVGKASVGYLRELGTTGPVKWSLGGLASAYRVPEALRQDYGRAPASFMVFLQARL